MSLRTGKNRFHALDLLRGFFIVIIICDHLSRWPSIFSAISGKALLWVTAAEGFIIISGLLVGYIRGYKNKAESLQNVTITLWRRALTLYLWAVIGSVLYTAAIWYIPLIGGAPGMPIEKGHWAELLIESITLNYTFLWVYFLKLYALYLAAAPLAIWLLRHGKAWVVTAASFGLLVLGWIANDEVLQWQFLFFIPAVVGFYIPSIQGWWESRTPTVRRNLTASIIGMTGLTIVLSSIGTFAPLAVPALDTLSTTVFAKDTMSFARIIMAFLWFSAYLLIFLRFERSIARVFGWLLFPIGTHSLTAYILHGAAIILISYFTVANDNLITNSLLGALAVLIVWFLVKIPGINRVIPK